MKPLFTISLSAILVLGMFCSVVIFSCVQKKDACVVIVCNHGGVCNKGAYGDVYCTCPSGYGGSKCDTLLRDEFIGYYKETVDSVGNVPHSVAVYEGASDRDILMRRMDNTIDSVVSAYVIDVNRLYIPMQVVMRHTVTGYITYVNGSQLDVQYTITDALGNNAEIHTIWTRH